jgi:hypothetical protein
MGVGQSLDVDLGHGVQGGEDALNSLWLGAVEKFSRAVGVSCQVTPKRSIKQRRGLSSHEDVPILHTSFPSVCRYDVPAPTDAYIV